MPEPRPEPALAKTRSRAGSSRDVERNQLPKNHRAVATPIWAASVDYRLHGGRVSDFRVAERFLPQDSLKYARIDDGWCQIVLTFRSEA
jgi:hypothetical protein